MGVGGGGVGGIFFQEPSRERHGLTAKNATFHNFVAREISREDVIPAESCTAPYQQISKSGITCDVI